MNFEDLKSIFVDELGASADGDEILLAESDKKVTILVSSDDGVMPVPKVRSVKANDRYLSIRTESGRTFVDRSSIFGVRSEDQGDRGASRPGFG